MGDALFVQTLVWIALSRFACSLFLRCCSRFSSSLLVGVVGGRSTKHTQTCLEMKGAKGKGGLSKQAEETNLKKKKQVSGKEGKAKKPASKSKKEKKDPNKPKRPPTPFFVFLEEFRKTFSANNPNVKAVSAVGKAGGDKWKSLSDAEKAPYVAKANARKVEYEKNIKAYNAKQDKALDDAPEEESDGNEEDGSEEEEDEE